MSLFCLLFFCLFVWSFSDGCEDAKVDVAMWLDVGGNEEELLDFEQSRAEVTSEYLLYHLYNFRARPCDDPDQFKVCFF